MRLVVIHRRARPAPAASFLARNAWKFGLGVVVAALLMARTAGPTYTHPRPVATSVVSTTVPCGAIKLDAGSPDTATWSAVSSPYGTGSPYILPSNDPNLPTNDPTHPNCLKPDPNNPANSVGDDIQVAPATKLVIDGSQGPVQIFSHGTGILVNGGEINTINTSTTNTISFDAEPDVPSWDGIMIIASDASHKGDASFSYVSLQHAQRAITINSGALSSPASPSYGLTVSNSGIGPSYLDGIDATNTPISVTGLGDGQFGTVNNIGSQGISVTFDPIMANYPAVIPAKSLDVENMTFGSSVPFGETNCIPLQPCAAGTIGNDAIQASFVPNAQEPLVISNNQFFRAGSYGLELTNANNPAITGNVFTCNGSGSPTPVTTCVGTGLRWSAIYLKAVANLALGPAGLNNNKGQQNGLDAIVLNGQVASQVVTNLTWQTPTNDSNAPSAQHPPHALGYMVANGDLDILNSKLTVFEGDVVKVKGGAIVLINSTLDAASPLDANGSVSSAPKTFTSMRDNGVGIQACPSVFVQSCPVPVPSNEWVGIALSGSSARIDNANILFPTKALDVSGSPALIAGPDAGSYNLVLTNSRIGPTFADSVSTQGLPIYVKGSAFCTIDPVASDVNYGHCTGSGPGNHGINAGYSSGNAAQGGLKILNNDFRGSTNEAILGTGLAGRPVDIENNTVEGAGTYGMQLVSADNLTLRNNAVTGSGAGNPGNATTYPAIYLNGVSNADFSSLVSGNSGSSNGLNGIAFHGSTANAKPLNWKTVGASAALGYIVDGDLMVNGDLTFFNGDVAPVLGGTITVKGWTLTANGARLTSLRQQGLGIPSCGSIFVLKVSGVCPPQAAGDWGGLVLDPGRANVLTASNIGYATTGISVGAPPLIPLAQNLTLSQTNVHDTSLDGVHSQSPLAISGGAFTRNGGHGIDVILGSASPWPLAIGGGASVSSSGLDGILATGILPSGLAGQVVQIQGVTVDQAGGYGIDLVGADRLTLTNNTITNSAPGFAAIYLNGFSGPFANISGNRGAGNGLDALAFHGTVTDDLTWQTARKTSDPSKLLGYLLDDSLSMQPGHTLTVNAGDIVKVGKGSGGGLLDLQGVSLSADNTGSSSQKVFTSLTDNSAGVSACPSALIPGCISAAAGDWAGIKLSGSGANGALVNAALRYASTGIAISSAASSTSGSSTYGLTISRSSFDHIQQDGVDSAKTALSVTDSTITGSGGRGINADLTGATTGTPLRFSGNRLTSTGAEAILAQALRGQPVWITDNQVRGAGTFGIRLLNADELVLRNNNISNSGGGPGAGAGGYPAIYLSGVTADFTRNIRGNVGSGNGLDVVAFHGAATGDLSWQTPTVNASTKALGYVLDGSLVVSDGTLTVHPGDVVKSLGGPITVSGGSLDTSSALAGTKLFTSLKDPSAYPQTCPSVLTGLCSSGPQPGDWGGIVITNDSSGKPGSGNMTNGQVSFAATALSIDSGPSASFGSTGLGLIVKGTTISDATGDGVNAQDTRISVLASTTIQRVGVHGIVATFFGGTPCVTACGTSLDIENVTVTSTGKDGIVASGLGGRPTIVNDNQVFGAGTYGIRLAGPDQLSLNRNIVNTSGGPGTPFRYPAIYLSGVKADFELIPGSMTVADNHGSGNGLDVMAIHGEATQSLTWLTTGVAAPVVVPPVPAGHFGYLLDGALTVDGTLKTNTGDVVKVLNGAIHVTGSMVATGTSFTSLKDNSVGTVACAVGYDSVFLQKGGSVCVAAASGDWAGITTGAPSTLTSTTIAFDDGLTVTGALTFVGGGMHDIAANAIVANGSPVSVTKATFGAIHGDAIDSSNSGSTDVITDDTFDHVTGVAINLQSSPGDLERNVFTNDTNPTVKTSGAAVTLQCSSIQSGGISGDAQLTVKESDFVAGVGVNAPAGASAENNWWGQGTGPSGQLSGGVTVTTYFATQNPTATIAITGIPSATQTLDNVKSDGKIGTGRVQATITFSRNMNPEATLPVVSYTSSPVSFDIGAWKTNDPRTWIGSAPVDGSLATNGTHTVSASGAHDCVPDPLHNLMTPASNTFVADTTTLPTVSVSAPDLIGAHSARLHGHIDPAGWATGAAHSGQFIATNLASPFDQHLYPTPPLTDKTTPLDVSVVASGLQASSTYSVQLQVPSVNGPAVEPTADTVTTTAAASKLVFTVAPPASVQAGATFSATAATEDPSGNVVSDFAGNASLALTVAGPATLSGTLTIPVANGIAAFTGLSVNKTGSYTLTATSSPALTSAISSSVAIQPGAATQLAFTVQPPATPTATVTMSPAIEVSIEDSLNNVVTGDSTTQVTVALTTANGASLSGSLTQTAASGVASFANLSVNKTGSYTLTATSSPALTSAISSSFTIQPGAATQLVFTVQPSGVATHNTAFAQQPVVSLEDASGNVVTTDSTSAVTLGLAGGDPSGILTCTTNPITVSNGVATFAGCAIDKASGTPYQLTATSAGPTLGPVSSANVTVS